MKRKISGWIDLLAVSVNYIVICFALSHMEIRFQHDPVFILFSASQIWVTGAFWGKVQKTEDTGWSQPSLLPPAFSSTRAWSI